MLNRIDINVYNELDDFCSEILDSEGLLKYIKNRKEFFENSKEAIEKYFGEDENIKEQIKSFTDFYYYYLAKYSISYLYEFNSKDYVIYFKKLIEKSGIDANKLNINWESLQEKEEKYEECLVDIVFAMINYELKKIGYTIFGINMGFESVIYYIKDIATMEKATKNKNLMKIFDVQFLETIYGEIFEVTGDLGVKNIEIGDFIEKREDGQYYSLFREKNQNVIIKNIDEDNENEVKIIL